MKANHYYFVILVPYFMKPGNELCTDKNTIDTLEECKVATSNLGITFMGTESISSFPKGCYAYKGGYTSYWNTHVSGRKNKNGHPICKPGESID